MNLSDSDKRSLLLMALQSIYRHLAPMRLGKDLTIEATDACKINCGVFVSVYVGKELRGCIGTFSEEKPLSVNVRNMAISASASDKRFSPVHPRELDQLKIEISVLSPRRQISDKNEIILGKHGIYMETDYNRGTFLPQVSVQQKWTVDEFLGNCARDKAGIGWDGWKMARLYTFEAIVFNSDELPEIVKKS